MTLVIATRGIDLSVGANMAITGAACALLLTRSQLPAGSVVLIGLAVAVVAGLWNGALVAYLRIQPIVATLILMVAGRGIAQLLTDGQIITFENRSFEFIGNGALLGLPFTIFIAGGVCVMALFLARKTIVGAFIEAVGGNEKASEYSGVNATGTKLSVYAFCGLCAGVAGMIAASDIKAADASNIGLNIELDAILAVVIGGTRFAGGRFNLIGSVIGALLIQTLTTTILMKGVGVEYTLVVKALVVIAVCVMQSPEAARRARAALGARP
jgi:simple sugar transport system permease protein